MYSLGIYDEWYTQRLLSPKFLSNLKPQELDDWKEAHGGQTVNESLRSFVLDNLGRPLDAVFRWIRFIKILFHFLICVFAGSFVPSVLLSLLLPFLPSAVPSTFRPYLPSIIPSFLPSFLPLFLLSSDTQRVSQVLCAGQSEKTTGRCIQVD